MMIEIDRGEVLRYLGYKGGKPTEAVEEMINSATQEVLSAAVPKSCHERFPLEIRGDHELLIAGLSMSSRMLTRNLAGCQEVFLFAATLGVAVDTLIRRNTLMDAAKGLVTQAAATAAIESYCDTEQEKLREKAESEGLHLRPRYSPGYGDLSLSCQWEIISVMKTPKNIGLTLTDSGLMVPMKSVTAIIGISPIPTACHRQGCEVCTQKDCAFRRS